MILRLKREKYIRHSLSVARRSAKRRSQIKKKIKIIRRGLLGMTAEERRLSYLRNEHRIIVTTPSLFTFLSNPNIVVGLIDKLEIALVKAGEEHKELYVDIWHVSEIDHATISALLAVLYRARKAGVRINGNWPKDKTAKQIFRNSGFIYSLFSNDPDMGHKFEINKENQLFTSNEHDIILVGEMTEGISSFITGGKHKLGGLYTTLGELMDNAVTHSGMEGRWWLSINYDRTNKKAKFVFIDYGVGVFTSLSEKVDTHRVKILWQKAIALFGADAMEKQLRSIITESAGQVYDLEDGRGEGIHGIYKTLERGELSDLYIATNRAFGDVSADKYEKITSDFKGTMYYWEISEKNVIIKP
jgi:hypothetical protein